MTIPQRWAAEQRAASTPASYAAFLRRQGFTTERIKELLARSFNRSTAQ
jgi:hypothetical protein